MYKIEITNKKTKQVVVYDNLTDVNKGEKLFFKFQLDTTNLEDGEYSMSLYEDGALLQTETLNVGNFSQNALQYTKGENIYVETLLDTKTEDRQVEINKVTVTIYPSEGQDAMTSVTVDASNVYNDGYEKGYDDGNEKGYEDGYEDGIAKGIIEQKEKLESVTITENGEYSKEDGYNKVIVNVKPKISVQEYGLHFAYSTFSTVPEWAVLDGITDATNLFYSCKTLTSVPYFDASKIISAESMFDGCSKLTTIAQLIFGSLTNTKSMFSRCSLLSTIPLFDTSKVSIADSMFSYCINLTTIPQFDFSSLTSVKTMFQSLGKLQSLPLLDFGNVTNISTFFGYSDNGNITDLGGFKNLKVDWNDNYGLYRCPNLTHQSLINVITNLYDFRANGDTTTTKTLKLNSNSMSLLTDDDKTIAINKGWTLTA